MIFMRLGHKQKEYIGKFLLDISKIILAVFVIGGLLPVSKITGLQILIAIDFQKNNFKMPIQNSYKFSKLGFKTVKFNI